MDLQTPALFSDTHTQQIPFYCLLPTFSAILELLEGTLLKLHWSYFPQKKNQKIASIYFREKM